MKTTRVCADDSGFTLIELMVAMAVLAVIILILAKMTSTTAVLTTMNNKHNDANDQARGVFDRMSDDIARMVRRRDVDCLFWKNTASTAGSPNDVMYFYTEGAGYFDTTTFNAPSGIPSGASNNSEKNSVSLVGYRINATSGSSDYNQVERLAKPLSWDGGAYNSGQPTQNSVQPNFMVFLTYPPVGFDVINGNTITGSSSYTDPTSVAYSAAYFNTTIYGAYSNSGNSGSLPSAVGTLAGFFLDSTDTCYRSIGSQVFRLEFAFQLKDGTMSDKPMMVKTSTNGIPSSYIGMSQRPLPTDDSANTNGDGTCALGTRWFDSTDQIGYICLDATPGNAIWHELGIQDVSAIIVTIAVIDKQGLVALKQTGGDLKNIAAALPDYAPSTATSTTTGDPAYLLDPSKTTGWAYALLPGKAVSHVTGSSKLPQTMISQVRLYQRYFYLNTF